MEAKNLIQTLKVIKENSQKRNFKESIDLIITLKDIDLKKPDQQVDFFTQLHNTTGKEFKIAALVGPELADQAKKVCDGVISAHEFVDYKDKKKVKKLADQYDFFIAQSNIMPQIALAFGKIFGPRGKMPNPKAGCVVPPNFNLKPLVDQLKKTVRVAIKTQPMMQKSIGTVDQKDEEVADNIATLYNQVLHHLPNERNNIRRIILKITMGKPIRIDDSGVILTKIVKPVEEKK